MTSIAGEQADQLAELTCARRAARYVEIVGWRDAVEVAEWVGKGYRSPSAWMAAATNEPVGACKRILTLGERLHKMPHVADLFRLGLVSEAAGHFLLRSPSGNLHEFSPPRLDLITRQDQLALT